jgi:calcium-dependent protein kinase
MGAACTTTPSHRPPPKSDIPSVFGSSAYFPARPSFRPPDDFKANLAEAFPESVFKQRYQLGKVLGEGITGSVSIVKDKQTQQEFAMKTINTKMIDPRQLEELSREIALLKTLDHPNIVRLMETYEDPKKNRIRIILELCKGGDCSRRRFHSEEEVRHCIAQVAQAIAHCHHHHVVHRDLKLENVLFTSDEPDAVVKVVDFAMSTLQPKASITSTTSPPPPNMKTSPRNNNNNNNSTTKNLSVASSVINNTNGNSPTTLSFDINKKRLLQTTCGTAYYMAPEMFDAKEGGYTEKVDIWAIGVLTYIILIGDPPFTGTSNVEIFQKIKSGQVDYSRKEWIERRISPAAMKFVKRLLTVDPTKRPSAIEVLCDPWLEADRVAIRKRIDPKVGREIVDSMARFHTYPKLRRAALMFLAKYAPENELNDLREFYVLADLDMSGILTLDELILVIETFGPDELKQHANELAEQLFASMDLDKGKAIGYLEFLASVIECRCELDETNLERAFDHLDTDRSGHISTDNLKSLLGERFSDEEVQAIILEAAQSVSSPNQVPNIGNNNNNVVAVAGTGTGEVSTSTTSSNNNNDQQQAPLLGVTAHHGTQLSNVTLREVEEKGISKKMFMHMMLRKDLGEKPSDAWNVVVNDVTNEALSERANQLQGHSRDESDNGVVTPTTTPPILTNITKITEEESHRGNNNNKDSSLILGNGNDGLNKS